MNSQSSHQEIIAALTVRRLSSSEASIESALHGMSAEDAMMVNKLRKASNRPGGTFFRLNTINSGESGSVPVTPKVSSRQPLVNNGYDPVEVDL